jgi:hypothetical protein
MSVLHNRVYELQSCQDKSVARLLELCVVPSILCIPCGIIFGTYFYMLFESVLSIIRMNNAKFEVLTAMSSGM